jgi:hypothetical protein
MTGYRNIMTHLNYIEKLARNSNNHENLKRLAKHSSNVATLASNILDNSAQVIAIRKKAANIRRHEVNHRLGRRRRQGRFLIRN